MAYQNIAYHKKTNLIHLWDDQEGYRAFEFKPYGYLPDPNGDYQSLNGTRLRRINENVKDNSKSYESDLN